MRNYERHETTKLRKARDYERQGKKKKSVAGIDFHKTLKNKMLNVIQALRCFSSLRAHEWRHDSCFKMPGGGAVSFRVSRIHFLRRRAARCYPFIAGAADFYG